MCDVPTQLARRGRARPPTSVPPPPDHAPVLAAHNKLTVLLMLAVDSDDSEPERMARSLFAEDQKSLIELSSQRWNDVYHALRQLEELLPDRTDPDRDEALLAHLRSTR